MSAKPISEPRLKNRWKAWADGVGAKNIPGPTGQSKGFPDRLVLLPQGGGTIYIEFKGTSYYSLTPLQEWWKKTILDSSPNRYFLIDSLESLERTIEAASTFIVMGKELSEFERSCAKKYGYVNNA